MRSLPRAVFAAALLCAPGLLAVETKAIAPAPQPGRATCESCHFDPGVKPLVLDDGKALSSYVDPKAWGDSVHASRLSCSDCHKRVGAHPHEPVAAADQRAYARANADTCNRCHYEHFTRALDGIHFKQLEKGDPKAPTCVDCHGAHDTQAPSSPAAINTRCATCHDDVATTYRGSVHGEALTKGNPDVPACTSCHGAHDIRDPRTADFHASSYVLCAKCHGDGRLMEKYGLSSDVLSTYLDDFHGSSNHLYIEVGHIPERPVATCGDCHGVHDVQRLDRADDAAVGERVEKMCRSCHEGAPEGFGKAWLSHAAPTFANAPLVAGVTWTYRILIPFIVVGLLLHIGLHLWRLPRVHRKE